MCSSDLQEMEEVLEYNYQLFNSKEFLNNAWKELTSNLKIAVESAPVLQVHDSTRLYRYSNAITKYRQKEASI